MLPVVTHCVSVLYTKVPNDEKKVIHLTGIDTRREINTQWSVTTDIEYLLSTTCTSDIQISAFNFNQNHEGKLCCER